MYSAIMSVSIPMMMELRPITSETCTSYLFEALLEQSTVAAYMKSKAEMVSAAPPKLTSLSAVSMY